MGSYLVHGPEIYPKAHENPRAFSCISSPIFLESSIQYPWGVRLHHMLVGKARWTTNRDLKLENFVFLFFFSFVYASFFLLLIPQIATPSLDIARKVEAKYAAFLFKQQVNTWRNNWHQCFSYLNKFVEMQLAIV